MWWMCCLCLPHPSVTMKLKAWGPGGAALLQILLLLGFFWDS